MDQAKAEKFAAALTALCYEHGVMLWTVYTTAPMILGSAPEAGFHYEAEPMEFGIAAIIRRVLEP